jgi:hypothetical protein
MTMTPLATAVAQEEREERVVVINTDDGGEEQIRVRHSGDISENVSNLINQLMAQISESIDSDGEAEEVSLGQTLRLSFNVTNFPGAAEILTAEPYFNVNANSSLVEKDGDTGTIQIQNYELSVEGGITPSDDKDVFHISFRGIFGGAFEEENGESQSHSEQATMELEGSVLARLGEEYVIAKNAAWSLVMLVDASE